MFLPLYDGLIFGNEHSHKSNLTLTTMKSSLIILFLGAVTMMAPSSQAADPQPAPYPLTTCVISGEKLGGMGKPFVFTYEGTEVELCCPHCKPDFDKDPAKYIKEIQAAKKSS
jgi:YHS domain-containing protein